MDTRLRGSPEGGSTVRAEMRHAVVLSGGAAVAAFLALIYQFVVGHQLGPNEYAGFATVLAIVNFGSVAAGPVNATAARFAAQFVAEGDFGRIRALTHLLASIVLRYGLVVCALALIAVRPLSAWLQFRSTGPLFLAVPILFLTVGVNLTRGLLRGVQGFTIYNHNVVIEAALRLVIGLPLVYLFMDASAAVGGYAAALAVLLPISLLQVRTTWRGAGIEPIDPRPVRRFGLPMMLFSITTAAYLTVDMVLVKHVFVPDSAGVYGGAVTLARLIGLVYAPFGVMVIPLFVAEASRGGRPFHTLLRICCYYLAVSLIPLIVFAAGSTTILTLAFGAAFSKGAPLLAPLAGAMLLAGLSALIGNALASRDRFSFLFPYIGGLALETSLISRWHESLFEVASLVLATQALTAAAIVITAAVAARRDGRHS